MSNGSSGEAAMNRKHTTLLVLTLFICLSWVPVWSAEEATGKAAETPPKFSLHQDMGSAMIEEAARVKHELQKKAESLFERQSLGWDLDTVMYLYGWLISLPTKIDDITLHIIKQGRLLGMAGSLAVLAFLGAVFYSLIGQKKVLARIEQEIQHLAEKLPEGAYPYFKSTLKVLVEALIPLILVGFFSLVDAMTDYQAGWFLLTGRVLILWTVGALINGILRETLTQGLLPSATTHGKIIYPLARLALFYVLLGFAVFWSAEAVIVRTDVISLIQFAVSISIVIVLYLLVSKKEALLSLLPSLPYASYQGFRRLLERRYRVLIGFSFITAMLWCLGYRQLGSVVLLKIWASAGAFVCIMLIYDGLHKRMKDWSNRVDRSDEAAVLLIRSINSVLLYATVAATLIIVLNLLGLLDPLQRIMSFPVFKLGATPVSFWTIIRAVFIFLAFVYISRLLQAYLNYKIFPTLKIDPGLGYALNTFLKYTTFAIGILISLNVVGIDLRFLLVFAGAAGIGIGLGFQNMAANLISGFSIIFGGKIRKGDWIETGNTLGVITDIYLRATKVRTRDNIEYLIPNADLISNVIVNYSLSSPMIRIRIPVGVSYDADPKAVEKILLSVAKNEPLVENFREPDVRFVEFGDNSINFELMIWINVQKTPRKRVCSQLYFAIFDELGKAGIEIPFPQRDLHIRSNAVTG